MNFCHVAMTSAMPCGVGLNGIGSWAPSLVAARDMSAPNVRGQSSTAASTSAARFAGEHRDDAWRRRAVA
ncbi:hypothetical protein VL15_13985 [Burkholderia cepacia]|uniref:Uncharacterized protein n=1 Tax=Burkholderia cepacia TaxID=292 RepID=A0A0J5X170_BURCE|nr:hypothetical protein VL15_13985 [Burkholderia cepacia]